MDCLLFVDSSSCYYFFFFSSRRRHTRLQGDWSSDVCSSDLAVDGRAAVDCPIALELSLGAGDDEPLVAGALECEVALLELKFRIAARSRRTQIGRASCRERV